MNGISERQPFLIAKPKHNYILAGASGTLLAAISYHDPSHFNLLLTAFYVLIFLINGYLCQRPIDRRFQIVWAAILVATVSAVLTFWLSKDIDDPIVLFLLPLMVVGPRNQAKTATAPYVDQVETILLPVAGSIYLKSERFAIEEIRQIAIGELDQHTAIVQFPLTKGCPQYRFPADQIAKARAMAEQYFDNARVTT